jgi:hypothetical protein
MDPRELAILEATGTDAEKRRAARLKPFLARHHLVLVTSVLFNALCNEALPVALEGLVNEYVSVAISATVVLFFGEILPNSIMTGPRQLQIASLLTPLVAVLIAVEYVIAAPLAWLLDRLIGHSTPEITYRRHQLRALIRLHSQTSNNLLAGSSAESTDKNGDSAQNGIKDLPADAGAFLHMSTGSFAKTNIDAVPKKPWYSCLLGDASSSPEDDKRRALLSPQQTPVLKRGFSSGGLARQQSKSSMGSQTFRSLEDTKDAVAISIQPQAKQLDVGTAEVRTKIDGQMGADQITSAASLAEDIAEEQLLLPEAARGASAPEDDDVLTDREVRIMTGTLDMKV